MATCVKTKLVLLYLRGWSGDIDTYHAVHFLENKETVLHMSTTQPVSYNAVCTLAPQTVCLNSIDVDHVIGLLLAPT